MLSTTSGHRRVRVRRTISFSNFSLSVSEANCAASQRLAPYSAAGACRKAHAQLVRRQQLELHAQCLEAV